MEVTKLLLIAVATMALRDIDTIKFVRSISVYV